LALPLGILTPTAVGDQAQNASESFPKTENFRVGFLTKLLRLVL